MFSQGADNKNRDGVLLSVSLLLINIFWGGSFIANAIALKNIGPIEIASLRFFIAAPLLAIITYIWKGRGIFKFDMKDAPVFLIMAATGVTFQYIIQVTAQSYTTATNASLLINTSVFFILILGALFLSEGMTVKKIIGATIGFIGVAFLVSKNGIAFNFSGHMAGDIMIIFCAFLWAVYSVYGKKISGRYHPLTVLNYVFIIGTIGFLPFYLTTPSMPLSQIPATVYAAIIFLAIFCSIIGYLVYNIALDKMGASSVAMYIYFVPLSTIVMAILILNESLTIMTAIGGILVLSGMYIAEMK
jgi:drug/metabolite transporter (DMT)-like permease